MIGKKYGLALLAVFVFVFIFDFLVHGLLLKDAYAQTAHLWRPEGEQKMLFMFLAQLGYSAVLGFIFTRNFENKGLGEGLRFGLLMGFFMGSVQIGTYGYMPLPLYLPLLWMASEILKGTFAGLVLSLVYRN